MTLNKNIAIFAASFDPITIGHTDIIKRASRLTNILYVVVTQSFSKSHTVTMQARVDLVKKVIASLQQQGIDNIEVLENNGLTIELANKLQANLLIRGIRNATDFEYESNLAQINKVLASSTQFNSGIDTIFLNSRLEYKYISSSLVRELISHNIPIDDYTDPVVTKEIEQLYKAAQ